MDALNKCEYTRVGPHDVQVLKKYHDTLLSKTIPHLIFDFFKKLQRQFFPSMCLKGAAFLFFGVFFCHKSTTIKIYHSKGDCFFQLSKPASVIYFVPSILSPAGCI